ncbi:hypothetical protein ACTFIZ_009621 [Dictyostelium cf. discoideum]
MKRTIILLLFVSLFVTFVLSQIPDNDPELCQQRIQREDCPQTPVPWGTFNEDDEIEVYYMQAPVFEAVFGNFFGKLGGYHSAIGFYDLTTGLNYTAEYDAIFEVGNGTLPNIINVDGKDELLWCNAGILCTVPYINETYWDKNIYSTASKTYMGTINGTQLNQYIEWMQQYNISNPVYQTWDVWNNYGQDLFVPSTTCDDFTQASIEHLGSIGINYNCSTVFKRDYINLFTEKPQPIDFTEHYDDIFKFYEAVLDIKEGSIAQIIERILSIVGLKKYIYVQGEYYLLELNYPFMNAKYDYITLPGCPANGIDYENGNFIHLN